MRENISTLAALLKKKKRKERAHENENHTSPY